MLELGYGEWWQLLELGYGEWWQKLETFFFTLDKVDGHASKAQSNIADGGVSGQNAKVYRGGENDDIIAGDKKQDRIKAGQGDDLVDGKGGHDVIWGEAGDDIIYGHDGNDLIYGGNDDDLILGETHDDELHGEAGHDIVSGGSGDDIVTGGEGKDDLKGGWGKDVLDGGDGNDRLDGEAGSDVLIGREGQDQLNGGGGDDILYGDAYDGDKSLKQLRTQLQAQAVAEESLESTDTAPANNSHSPIRVEAESMTLTGDAYIYTDWNNDSGDSVKTNGTSTATTTFSGQSGSYLVVARYFDEENGNGKLEFGLNGTSLNSFDLDLYTDHYYTRTVAQNLTLNAGDEFTITATADGADDAAFDYLEFIPLDNLIETRLESTTVSSTFTTYIVDDDDDDNESITTTSTWEGFRVEAESMTLVGDYYTEANSIASGGNLIKVKNQGQGKALTGFSGEAGYYNIVVGYYDENDDGIAQISAALNHVELDAWSLDQNLGSNGANAQTFTTRTVASTVFLRDGDIFELTGLRGEGNDSDELARIDYVDFVKVDWGNGSGTSANTGSIAPIEAQSSTPVVIGETIRVEAESMSLDGYLVESNSNPSGGQLIKTNSNGTATTQFSGNAGYYNIVIAYYDENDGLSTISASLDGVELDEWQLNQNLGSDYISSDNRVTRTIATQIQVNTGDELTLGGIREYGEYARIDYVEFVPVSAPVASVVETTHDDFLQGGAGNDTVYGGEGHDTLYGDSQTDDASTILKGAQTHNGHTYLFSSAGTWDEVQAEAQRLGGNLVTINDAAEESWIRDVFSDSEQLWTGLNDVAIEGQFEWISGESVTYTNWAPGEPSNSGGNEDYGVLNYFNQWHDTASNGAWTWDDQASQWQWQEGLRGVIEINATNNDILVGGSGDDTIYGNGGDDVLYGDEESSQNVTTPNNTDNHGLVGHWSFDETTGTHAKDLIGNNDGTLVNMNNPNWENGLGGGALRVSGGNDQVEVSDSASLDITDTLTLATWVRADAFESWDGLINKGQSNIAYGLSFTSDGRLAFQANYGSVTGGNGSSFQYSNARITTGRWHHVAVTYDGNNVQFYIDGQLDSTHQADITFGTNNEALMLGADLTGSHLDGALDDARVYGRALSAEEITQITTGTNSGSDSNNHSALPNGEIYNGSLYLLTDTVMTWADAQAYAETINGNLITINNAAEDQWLKDTFVTSEALWTGFSDAETEGTWQWASGEGTEWVLGGSNNNDIYVNWAPGQPDNNGGQADAAVLSHIWNDNYSGWDDTPADALFKGIIEIKLPSAEGNDVLYGGSGNDTLEGGAGNDVLDGTDAIAAGYFEKDILGGGLGRDTFVLGSDTQAYYIGASDLDYATIKDFNSTVDVLQLHGSAGDYQQQQQSGNLYLSYNDDLIAVLENVTAIDFNGSNISYT